MERNYNEQVFDKKDKIQVKQFFDFLKVLMQSNDEHYNDIHIYEDDFYYVIEWVQNGWNDECTYNRNWKLLDPEDTIYTDIILPDRTYETIPKGTEDEFMAQWHKENPGWIKTEYGTWFNEKEQKKLEKEILYNKKEEK